MPNQKNSEQDNWEDIFETIDMDYLPLEYISLVVVDFDNGDVWEIDIKKSSNEADSIEDVLEQFFEEYQDTIVNVDFRLDIDKIKKDITKRTKRFLKLNK